MTEIIEQMVQSLTEEGWQITVIDVAPLKARFLATDSATEATCEVDLLKEVRWRPPDVMDIGPVLDLDDLMGTKVRVLGDRGLARDAIDVHAAATSTPSPSWKPSPPDAPTNSTSPNSTTGWKAWAGSATPSSRPTA
ncbi:hypothetical protein AB0D14_13160 [Streptomyces sp. NPDC048484]|uniref:hypothetical protein n=1 Tax=Streptomyces sp. NPDC048484 TaxID=3155146 RepID=UPI003414E9F2